MKKWIIFVCTVFCLWAYSMNIYAADIEQTMNWTVQWKGLIYTGNYMGEIQYGRPNGKGKFQGYLTDAYSFDNEIIFDGEWKDGKIDGEGKLTEVSTGTCYEGIFLENKLNGKIRKTVTKNNEIPEYFQTNYTEDIPYGISYQYSSQGEKIGYDYYFFGTSVRELCEKSKIYDYSSLSYRADEFKNKNIKLECEVLDIYDETIIKEKEKDKDKKEKKEEEIIKIRTLKVQDSDGNKYALHYKLGKAKYETIYMPFFKKNDYIVVYGFYNGLETIQDTKLPSVNVIYGIKSGIKKLDAKKPPKNYSNFLDYPYIFEERSVFLKGKVTGTYEISEEWIYIFVDSDSYSPGEKERYICRIKKSDTALNQLPETGETVTINGKLKNLKECGAKKNLNVYLPVVKVTSINKKEL